MSPCVTPRWHRMTRIAVTRMIMAMKTIPPIVAPTMTPTFVWCCVGIELSDAIGDGIELDDRISNSRSLVALLIHLLLPVRVVFVRDMERAAFITFDAVYCPHGMNLVAGGPCHLGE